MATNGTNGTKGASEKVFLIWGGEGWVAGHLKELLQEQKEKVFTTTVRMENREAVMAELERVKPTHVLNCAGCTGRPNVDWCEDNKEQVIRSNVIGTLNLTDCCFLKNIHCTVFATGCMFCVLGISAVEVPADDQPRYLCLRQKASTRRRGLSRSGPSELWRFLLFGHKVQG